MRALGAVLGAMVFAVTLAACGGGRVPTAGARTGVGVTTTSTPAPTGTIPSLATSFRGSAIPAGTTISSTIRVGRELIAAGGAFTVCGQAGWPPCDSGLSSKVPPGYGEPIVWTSSDNGANWTRVWAYGGVDVDSGAFLQLAVTPAGTLLMFDTGTPGTVLWRAADPSTWTRTALPPAMQSLTVVRVWSESTSVVVVMKSKFAGVPQSVWSSVDGTTWTTTQD